MNEAPINSSSFNAPSGEIPALLVKEGFITDDQLAYAVRIKAKLSSNNTLIDTIKELGYATGEQIRDTLSRNQTSIRIGSLLVELGYLREPDLNAALNLQKESPERKKLGEVLIENGFIDEQKFNEILASQLGIPLIELGYRKINAKLFAHAPIQKYRESLFIPVEVEENRVVVAFADPLDKASRANAEKIFGDNMKPVLAARKAILEAIDTTEKNASHPEATVADESTVIGIINKLFEDAITENASDIHIEPMKDRIRIRFRYDGVMMHHKDLPLEIAPQLSTRIKVMAQADIAERRRHQDGRILFESRKHGYSLDVRVSIYVTIFGEKIVMRLLNKKGVILDVHQIGMAPRMLDHFIYDALESPTGVMIITGPTGSGKTSTLYSCLGYLNNINTSIITAEDPVEYVIDGISQCSINQKIGVSFEETLRHIVRQDPDIIVLGEIRDTFSAETAIQAALTGHKVLTTFHTEDSIGGLIRLMNMQIEAFLISSTVVCVVAQRLLRLVCKSCSRPYTPTPLEYNRLGYTARELAGANFLKGEGCKDCRFTGFHGRMAVFELLVLNETVKEAILGSKSSAEIRRLSMETTGLVTLFEDGLLKAAVGLVSVQEVLRDLPRISRPRPLNELKRISGC
jgi:type IV pilus assembly protein PilB